MVELYNSNKLRGRVGDILDKVLRKRYPKEIDRILHGEGNEEQSEVLSLDELLEWELWPTYMTVYSEYVRVV